MMQIGEHTLVNDRKHKVRWACLSLPRFGWFSGTLDESDAHYDSWL